MSGMTARASRIPLAALALWAALGPGAPLLAQKDWPPVTPEEMALTDGPPFKGAKAVLLYREEVVDHEAFEIRVFKRLKVLTAEGRDVANIEIPYSRGWLAVKDIEARVVPADGKPRPFFGEVLEKTVLRTRKTRIKVKALVVPDVEVGSIIDYRYKLVRDTRGDSGSDAAVAELGLGEGKPAEGGIPADLEMRSFLASQWGIQDDLFTRRARFVYKAHPRIAVLFGGRSCRIAWITRGLGGKEPAFDGERLTLEMENVPAFEEEEFMAPREATEMAVAIFFLAPSVSDQNEYWKLESKSWQKGAEAFIGDPRKVEDEAKRAVGEAAAPADRLRRLYERVQKVRNLSYERTLTRKQRKEQKIKDNRTAADVLARGYGVRSDITRAFVALARASGFDAWVARAATRDDKIFNLNVPSFYDQLDSEVAVVALDGLDKVFDPATPFCPFGIAHWSRTNTMAVRFSDEPPAFFTTPAYPPEAALTQREMALELDPEGNLRGTVKVIYTGHEALVRRLDRLHGDEEGTRQTLEQELAGVLPSGAAVSMTRLDGIETNADDVVAHFEITVPGLATPAGDRLLLPVSPLLGASAHPFRHARRKLPVIFPYPFRDFEDIVISIPEGLAVESLPGPRESRQESFTFSIVCAADGERRLHVQRDLLVKKSYFPTEQYAGLRAFFDLVRTADEEQIVLAVKKRPR